MFFCCCKQRNVSEKVEKKEKVKKEKKTSWWRRFFKRRSDRGSPKDTHSVENAEKPNTEKQRSLKNDYKVGKSIGAGGFGAVYEGTRRSDGLKVAVKFVKKNHGLPYVIIPHHPIPIPTEVALLILANKGPRAPEIIGLIDWYDEPDRYIIVMERPPGFKTLSRFVKKFGYITEETAHCIMRQVVQAVLVCTERGVFHRDIKLENLLINKKTMEVKLIDFGAGELLWPIPYRSFIGTDVYCPPELNIRGSYYAEPATVWSLGILLFRQVMGRYPNKTDHAKFAKDRWSSHLSAEFRHLIGWCLQQNPDNRPKLKEILLHAWFQESPEDQSHGPAARQTNIPEN
ncbi:putative serine/threonine-protein kinase pim-2-like [Triplophysa rosa]|uniref:non-specific serine/threonine protein kinase n=1 Tax=Triplophysa rosa TaxID=992332 RepID=A0A9W7WZS1_TRIRA|nr:putative serine/threonine-protein kinase pim-2-like [Triplophysa rosa]